MEALRLVSHLHRKGGRKQDEILLPCYQTMFLSPHLLQDELRDLLLWCQANVMGGSGPFIYTLEPWCVHVYDGMSARFAKRHSSRPPSFLQPELGPFKHSTKVCEINDARPVGTHTDG